MNVHETCLWLMWLRMQWHAKKPVPLSRIDAQSHWSQNEVPGFLCESDFTTSIRCSCQSIKPLVQTMVMSKWHENYICHNFEPAEFVSMIARVFKPHCKAFTASCHYFTYYTDSKAWSLETATGWECDMNHRAAGWWRSKPSWTRRATYLQKPSLWVDRSLTVEVSERSRWSSMTFGACRSYWRMKNEGMVWDREQRCIAKMTQATCRKKNEHVYSEESLSTSELHEASYEKAGRCLQATRGVASWRRGRDVVVT